MRNLNRALLLVAALPLLTAAASAAQQLNAPARLLAARKLYYTPTAKGLTFFRCNATVDWKAMLTRFSGAPVPDNNPFLVYLQSAHLEVSDNLDGNGKLTWTDTSTASASLQSNATQLRAGVIQMIGGFFQSWNQFVNGGMVPAPNSSTTETNTEDGGLHLHGKDGNSLFDEDFDQNMLLLLSQNFITDPDPAKGLSNTSYPTFEASTDGLLVNRVRSVIHQPPTAPAQEISVALTYASVQGFQLPATLAVTLVGTGEFDFTFNNCAVKTTTTP